MDKENLKFMFDRSGVYVKPKRKGSTNELSTTGDYTQKRHLKNFPARKI